MNQTIDAVKFGARGYRAVVNGREVPVTEQEYRLIIDGYDIDLSDRTFNLSFDRMTNEDRKEYALWLKKVDQGHQEQPEVNEDEVDYRASLAIGFSMF